MYSIKPKGDAYYYCIYRDKIDLFDILNNFGVEIIDDFTP